VTQAVGAIWTPAAAACDHRAMIELYFSPGTAAMVVHWLLLELDVPHELRRVDLASGAQHSAEYRALNPAGRVPTLVEHGIAQTEAAAITMQLADRFSPGELSPAVGTAERAAYYQWMFFCANTLQPHYRAWFYPDEPAGPEHVDAVKARAREAIEGAWAQVAAHLGDGRTYMLGEGLTALDFMVTMLMRWSRNMPRPSDRWPVLAAYAARMKARPSFRELYTREGLTEWP
jgi:glutathione S-transferase